jgi:glycerol uptake facilitator protein
MPRNEVVVHGPLFGEFMGTMVLILLGDGVVANVLLKKSKGEGSGWIVIATGWGLGVTAGIFTAVACGSLGAHINPAVTLAVALTSHSWANVVPFWIAQVLGGFTGALLVWLAYLPHWKETPDQAAKLGIFCTAPAIRSLQANAMTEIIGTTTLIGVGFAFTASAVAPNGLRLGMLHIFGDFWSEDLDCRLAVQRDMPSTLRAISVHAWRTSFCRLPERASRIGAML